MPDASLMTPERVQALYFYSTADFFMFRTPLLPLNVYETVFSRQDEWRQDDVPNEYQAHASYLIHMALHPSIREALAISSPSLLTSLDTFDFSFSHKKSMQRIRSLTRYLIRITTRPTPFGLLSGLDYGTFKDNTQLSLEPIESYKKYTRPDMEWLLKIISDLEKDERVIDGVMVQSNTSVYKAGNRLNNPYHTGFGQNLKVGKSFQNDSVTIRLTPVVEDVLSKAYNPLPFIELQDWVHSKYPDVAIEVIKAFLNELIRQEFLMTSLRPPLMNTDPFPYLLQQLASNSSIEDINITLNTLYTMIQQFDRLPIGKGEAQLRNIQQFMKQIHEAKDLLQVDLALSSKPLHLHNSIQKEIERAADVLWRLSPTMTGSLYLQSYLNDFMERYGVDQEVSLLELLDTDLGLGAPATYLYPPSNRTLGQKPEIFPKQREVLIEEWIRQAIMDNSMEIVLTDEKIKLLQVGEIQEHELPTSMELYFNLTSPSASAVDEGNYQLILAPNPGSLGAGKTFGRFMHMMKEPFKDKLKQLYEEEKRLSEDAISVEIVYLPSAGRSANLVISENHSFYELAIGTHSSKSERQTIPVSDILVGCQDNRFYLKSKSLGKRIVPHINNMLDWSKAPNIYHFMADIAFEGKRRWVPIHWTSKDILPVIPRIRVGRVVLVSAEWRLNQSMLEVDKGMLLEEWMKRFAVWRKKMKIPQYVYLREEDHRLLLNLDQILHVDLIRQEYERLQPGELIRLTETGNYLEEHCCTGPEGAYMTEITVPLLRTPVASTEQSSPSLIHKHEYIPMVERLHLPGSDWLYVKMYGFSQRQEEFIADRLYHFVKESLQEGWMDQFFFIRYYDEGAHLRIRFHGNPAGLVQVGIPKLYQWAKTLQQEGLLSRIVIDSYDPEIERYGGESLISAAERLFCQDSLLVTEWIRNKQNGLLDMDYDFFSIVSVIDILEKFGYSISGSMDWLIPESAHKEYLDLYRNYRTKLLGWIEPGIVQAPDNADRPLVMDLLNARSAAIRAYAEQVQKMDLQGDLLNHPQHLVKSIIHMHVNRLIGTDRIREMKILTLARHTMRNLTQIRGMKS
ncbi:lantibiotic dehydratase [Paenibacillus arenosi]|uniref:Lantibiotic dehydratase n=1 Tax=Paenibacillus arenosi TaxID=2774142 RepID=A0ABR9B3A7_9BACL|nr:lantibiotic dehydratase [Paenibacillus arenosi]MBD8500852.1 lantibiotic dehydratase [Paenibacillus arenosi]